MGIKRTQIISIPIQIKSFASMFLNSPHLVSGYYGTIAKRFSEKIFVHDHKYSLYYVSAYCYYRIEQYFRSGDLDPKLKKARFQLMLLVRLICMGETLEPFNSNKIDAHCDNFKKILFDDERSLNVFKEAITIFNGSIIDKDKSQYKAESDTEALIISYQKHNN